MISQLSTYYPNCPLSSDFMKIFFQNTIEVALQHKNLVAHERSNFSCGLFSFVSGDFSEKYSVDCTLLELFSIFEGTVRIKTMVDAILKEPKIKNGSLNPPTLYNQAPTAGPAIHFLIN